MKALSLLATALLFCFTASTSAAVQSGLIVSHHEEFREFSLRNTALNSQSAPGQASSVTSSRVLSFNALGRSYDLQLVDNSRLLTNEARQSLTGDIQIYRGQVAGAPDSWVRITIIDGMPVGMIWDGEQMIAIEGPDDNALGSASPIIYRLEDTYVVPGTMSCGDGSAIMSGAAMYDNLVAEISAAQAPGATSEMELSAIGDFEFTDDKGANAANAIITRLNTVDGIFSRDVGVQFSVPVIETFSGAADPFSDTTFPNDLLVELGAYRAANNSHNSRGLTHLYTGKDLDGTTVGIAYTGVLCLSSFGAGLSQGNLGVLTDALVAAHEIGHNFGAPHDGVMGSACESETGMFLMAASINNSQEFSACSVAEMQPHVNAASCITPLPTTDLSIALSGQAPTVLLGNSATLTFNLVNVGTDAATNVSADVTLPNNVTFVSVGSSAGSCTSGAGTANCQLGTMAGGASETFTVSSISNAVGVGTFDATISADVDDNAANDQASVQITVDPAVDLVVTPPATQQVDVGSSRNVAITIENQSSIAATGLVLSTSVDAGLQLDSAAWTVGSCTITGQQIDCTAATLGSQASSSLTLGVTGLSAGMQNFSLSVTANEADRDTTNNNGSGAVDVNTAGGGGGGGSDDKGGGAFGAVLLALLALMLANRRRRYSPRLA